MLAIKRSRLLLLEAALSPGERPDPERPRKIEALREEIRELSLQAGETFRLPYRADQDGPFE